MTAYPTWTPASRPGIVPLRPLTFGLILGRSFTALRQNPRVLLGFALVVQSLVTILAASVLAAVGIWAMMRVASLRPSSPDFETIMAGSFAVVGVVALVVSLASSAFGVIVQGVVVLEVAHEVLAEKLTLRQLWRAVRPVVWRLVGYSLAVMTAVSLLVALVVAGLVLLSTAIGWATLAVGIPLLLAAFPLTYWLTVKLLLVPATIVVEHATVRGAIARSWRLTRGRFWPALGITVIISLAFGALAQVVSTPLSLVSMSLGTIFAPSGDPDTTTIVTLIVSTIATQIVIVLVQTVALVVQSTATSLIYVDCRMRHEGLDQDLLSYVEQRDAGATDLPDPYRLHIGRTVAPRPATAPGAPYPAPGGAYPAEAPVAAGYPPQGGYGQPYGHQYGHQPQGGYGQPPAYAVPAYGQNPGYGQTPYGQPAGYGQPAQAPAEPLAPTAPGLGTAIPPAPAPAVPEAPASVPPPSTPVAPVPPAAAPPQPSPTQWTAPGDEAR